MFEEQQKKHFFTISLIIWHKDMNIRILMGISSYFLSTLPQPEEIIKDLQKEKSISN